MARMRSFSTSTSTPQAASQRGQIANAIARCRRTDRTVKSWVVVRNCRETRRSRRFRRCFVFAPRCAETAPMRRYKRSMKSPADASHHPSRGTSLEEVVSRMPALARVIAKSCLTPLMQQHACLRAISSDDWDFFVPMGAIHAGMERLRITLDDPERVEALYELLTASLTDWETDAPRALRD